MISCLHLAKEGWRGYQAIRLGAVQLTSSFLSKRTRAICLTWGKKQTERQEERGQLKGGAMFSYLKIHRQCCLSFPPCCKDGCNCRVICQLPSAHEPSRQELCLFSHWRMVRYNVGCVSAVRCSQLLGNLLHGLHRRVLFFHPNQNRPTQGKQVFKRKRGTLTLERYFFFREKSKVFKKHCPVVQLTTQHLIVYCLVLFSTRIAEVQSWT